MAKGKEFTFSHSVQGWVKTTAITASKYTPEQIIDLLNKGEALTTIQEDGDIILLKDGEEIVIAHILNIDNNTEYDNFS